MAFGKLIVAVGSGIEKYMTNDIPYPFRQYNNFLYLTGFQEPDSYLALIKDTDTRSLYFLFVRPRDPKRELWNGPRAGIEGAKRYFGPDMAFDTAQLHDILVPHIANATKVFIDVPHNLPPNLLPKQAENLDLLIQQMRLRKSPSEVALMRRAGQIAGEAFREAMRATKSTPTEDWMSALLEYECRKRGARCLAYPPVVANGIMNNTLHYIYNDNALSPGNLMLVDAGAEYQAYNSDITRTWPVSGKFTEPQREVYEIVLNVQKRCIEACHDPTMHLRKLHNFACDLFVSALRKTQILRDPMSIPLRTIFPHSIGHYLGMDVHDTPDILDSETFVPGFVVTVEPGLYLPDDDSIRQPYRGIGIRIEDDVLITDQGVEVLTASAPKEASEIEEVMASS